MKKNFLKALIVLAIVPVMAFTGCIEKKDDSSDTNGDKSFKAIQEKGELVLGLDASFPPMGFKDDDDNIVGFDIDIAREVCNRLDIKLKTQPIDWNMKETELDAGNIDCIWNGMSFSDKRNEAMNLSKPYMSNAMIFMVRKDSGITSLSDLKDMKIAVQNGSTAQGILADNEVSKTFKETVPLADNVAAFIELENKTVDGIFLDKVVADYHIKTNNADFVVLDEGLTNENYVIGFRKNDEALKVKIEETLVEMKKDGKLAEISTKWFGKDVTTIK